MGPSRINFNCSKYEYENKPSLCIEIHERDRWIVETGKCRIVRDVIIKLFV
jgi:hypothetical protein